jgi:hypothetical protein
MRFMNSLLKILLLSMIPFLVTGCYRFSQSTLPAHIKSILIQPVQNQTMYPMMGEDLYAALQQAIRRQASSLRQVNAGGNSELTVRLLSYQNTPGDYDSQGRVRNYRVILRADVVFKDLIRDEILYEGKALEAIAFYDVLNNQTELVGQREAIKNLQELIVSNILSGW